MSWRTGSKLFCEIWPLVQSNITDRQERIEFTGRLIAVFSECDMDTWDIEDVHPDIRAAIRHIGLDIVEPERYTSDNS